MGCPSRAQSRNNVLHHYRKHTTDNPWLIRKGDIRGVPCEFKIGLMYCITTGLSKQTPHGSSVRAIRGVSLVSSKQIYVLHHYRTLSTQPMVHSRGRYMGCPLWVQSRINVLHYCRTLTTDTPWLIRKGDTLDVPCEFKVRLMYCITIGPSEQTPHGLSVTAIHEVSHVSSRS